MSRPTSDEYFMGITWMTATRSTCPRLHVGCVLVDASGHVISTGYNGSLPGLPHCDDVGCAMDDLSHCIRTVHAEANAVAHLTSGEPSSAYVTHFPCWTCLKLLVASGVRTVYYGEWYSQKEQVAELIEQAQGVLGVSLVRVDVTH